MWVGRGDKGEAIKHGVGMGAMQKGGERVGMGWGSHLEKSHHHLRVGDGANCRESNSQGDSSKSWVTIVGGTKRKDSP